MEIISECLVGTDIAVNVVIGKPFYLCEFSKLNSNIRKSLTDYYCEGRMGDFHRAINNLTLSDLPVPADFSIVTSICLTSLTKNLTTTSFVNKFKADTSWKRGSLNKTYIPEYVKELVSESTKYVNEDQVEEEFSKLFDSPPMILTPCNFYIDILLYKKYREYVNS